MSIEDIKSVISKKGGVARTNRFQVIFTPPKASLLNTDAGTLLGTLLSGGSARNLINDPRDISILCASASFPGRSLSTIEYQSNKQTVKMPYTYIDSDVTLSFILTNDYYVKNLFEDWYSSIFNVDSYKVGYKKDYATDVTILQLNSENKPVYGVVLEKAFPIDVSAIELSNETENDYAKVDVTFAYDKYSDDIGSVASGAIGSVVGQVANTLGLFG